MKIPISFYVAYPKNERLKNLLNSLKILADSSQRTEAHITVRGPYKKKLSENDLKKFSDIISGETLTISKVDNFFAYNQNTVFFKCEENDKLRKIWKKITYNEFKPHITIYDGENNDFAYKLYNILSRDFSPLYYEIEKLSWLEPKSSDKLKLFHLNSTFDYNVLNNILDTNFNSISINNISIDDKLLLIEKVCNHLYIDSNGYKNTIANK